MPVTVVHHTCDFPLYDPSVKRPPFTSPCGKPATFVKWSGKTVQSARCQTHKDRKVVN